jgi:hypothetical protein
MKRLGNECLVTARKRNDFLWVVEEAHHEEGSRAVLDGLKNQAVTGELLTGLPVTASSALYFCAPVLELADRRGLQPRAHSGRPGPIPGWGIITT